MEPLQGAHLVPAPSSTHHQREANTQPSPSPSVLGSRSEGQARASLALSHWRHRRPGAPLLFHRPEARMCGRGPQRGLHGSVWAAPQIRINTGAGADSLGPVSTCEEHEQGTGVRENRDKADSPPTRQPCRAGGLGAQGPRQWSKRATAGWKGRG